MTLQWLSNMPAAKRRASFHVSRSPQVFKDDHLKSCERSRENLWRSKWRQDSHEDWPWSLFTLARDAHLYQFPFNQSSIACARNPSSAALLNSNYFLSLPLLRLHINECLCNFLWLAWELKINNIFLCGLFFFYEKTLFTLSSKGNIPKTAR